MRSTPTKRRQRSQLAILVVVSGLLAFSASSLMGQGFRWPEEPENLQVLPENVKGRVLGQYMRGFASALGVRCSFCHVGEGPDLTQYDFPADDKLTKQKARVMIEMVQAINGSHLERLTELGVPAEERIEVTCMTCHRTNNRPVMLDDLLAATIDSAGVEAAIAQYRELREENYGGFAYNFGSGTLIGLGEQLAGEGEVDAAIAILELEIEVNGESSNVYFTLGGVQARADMREDAIASFEKGLALAPDQFKVFFQREIDRLRER